MSPAIPTPPANAHSFQYRVPYSETDAMSRVYYANYLIWLERSRTEMLRDLGFPYRELEEQNILLPVRHCEIRYFGYARYDDVVTLRTWIKTLKRARIEFLTVIYAPEESTPITVGTVELACVSREGKPQPLPAAILDAFTPYLPADA